MKCVDTGRKKDGVEKTPKFQVGLIGNDAASHSGR